MNISARFASMNNSSFKVEAVLTKFSRSRNRITAIMNPVVKIMEKYGVPRRDTLLNIPGKSSSFPMAMGSRDAANMPAFPVDRKASIAAMLIMIRPNIPIIASPPRDIGINVPSSSPPSTTPIVIRMTEI